MSGHKEFEAHMTFNLHHEHRLVGYLRDNPQWAGVFSFSRIAGDPDLGKDTRCYLTAHSNDYSTLRDAMDLVEKELMVFDVKVLRKKIERIVYDTYHGIYTLEAPSNEV